MQSYRGKMQKLQRHSLSGRTQGATARHVTTPTSERYFSTEWPERLQNRFIAERRSVYRDQRADCQNSGQSCGERLPSEAFCGWPVIRPELPLLRHAEYTFRITGAEGVLQE
jgi:hypothetical protein